MAPITCWSQWSLFRKSEKKRKELLVDDNSTYVSKGCDLEMAGKLYFDWGENQFLKEAFSRFTDKLPLGLRIRFFGLNILPVKNYVTLIC